MNTQPIFDTWRCVPHHGALRPRTRAASLVACWLLAWFSLAGQAAPRFEDVSATAGIAYSGTSSGASWGDVNGDGWPDLYTSNHEDPDALFINQKNGKFARDNSFIQFDVAGDRFDTHTGAFADFDNDGDQDLIVINGTGGSYISGRNVLYVNNGTQMVDRAEAYGLTDPDGRGRNPLWFDWNGDRQLDVLISNLWRTDGLGSTAVFTRTGNVFDATGYPNPLMPRAYRPRESWFAQLSLSNTVIPNLPLVVLHDNQYPQGVYRYGDGKFTNVMSAFKFPGQYAVEDVTIGDFNGDRVNDFYLARINNNADRLLIQSASGFSDRTAAAGVSRSASCNSVVSGDFDNDKDLDIYVGCELKNGVRNVLFENIGAGTFRLVANAGGAPGATTGSIDTVTVADYDRDGFLDLFMTYGRLDALGPNKLYHNRRNANHWLEVDLVGRRSNRDGIGTRVLLTTPDNRIQLREANGGMHYRAQNHTRLHFGLGASTGIKQLRVLWPSGVLQTFGVSSNVDRILRVVEPQ